jgi:hypothetical protein
MSDNASVLKQLEEKLLTIKGTTVDLSDPSCADLILVRGQLIEPKAVYYATQRGTDSHLCTSLDYQAYRGLYRIVTGYALYDNVWERHTWLQTADNTIMETHVRREAYFGAILDDKEADQFSQERVDQATAGLRRMVERPEPAESPEEEAGPVNASPQKAQKRLYSRIWCAKEVTDGALSPGHLGEQLRDASYVLDHMEQLQIWVDETIGTHDGHAVLYTTDPKVAREYGFHEVRDPEEWEEEEEEEEEANE